MSLEAWGDSDEEMRGPDGYVTEECAAEMVEEAVKSITEERDAVLADLRKCEQQLYSTRVYKARDLIEDRLGAFRKGHASDATAWEHYNTGFAEGMLEALNIVKAVIEQDGEGE